MTRDLILLPVAALTLFLVGGANAQTAALVGPKRVLAVGRFDAVPALTNAGPDVCNGLAAMLTTELAQSGRFIVVERPELSAITTENALKVGRASNPEGSPTPGVLTGAQFYVFGTIVQFGAADKGSNPTLGFGGGSGLLAPLTANLSKNDTKGAVSIDLRIVNSSTGQVVAVHRVSEPVLNKSSSFSLGYSGATIGSSDFDNTPIGQASRAAMDDAVAKIIEAAQHVPWQGQVVAANSDGVIINVGAEAGILPGQEFIVERPGDPLTDPGTGVILSIPYTKVGSLRVVSTEQNIAHANFTASAADSPRRGDRIVTP